MEELEFLTDSDENILEAEVVFVDGNKGLEPAISLIVGMSNEDYQSNLSEGKILSETPSGHEIILTEGMLKKMIKTIKENK